MEERNTEMKRNRNSTVEDVNNAGEGPSSKRTKELVREVCQYGINCYRRSPSHFMEFKHVELETLFLNIMASGSALSSAECGQGFANPTVVRAQLEILHSSGMQSLIQREAVTAKPSTSESSNGNTVPATATVKNVSPVVCITTSDAINAPKECHKPSMSMSATSGTSLSPHSTTLSSSSGKPPTTPGMSFPKPSMTQGSSSSKGAYPKVGTPLSKWENSCPFNFFLTSIPEEKNAFHCMSFRELFHPSLGEVAKLCHFNFMVETDWYLEQTLNAGMDGKETTVIHGVESSELKESSRAFPWLTVHHIKSPFPFGHHHTKMSLIQYTDGSMRFVIYTANLIESDWENRTQGLWMSPRCPPMEAAEKANNSNVAGSLFKPHLIEYLTSYPSVVNKCLSPWISAIRKISTAEIKVIFIGSAPVTSQSSQNGFQWGLKKVNTTLKRFQPPGEMDPSWPLLIQCSSIGSLGPSDEWLRGEFGRLMGINSLGVSTPVKVVYPSDRNVRASTDGIYGGSCLPYSRATHSKQLWLRKLLHVWKANLVSRTRCMPHIKTYGRISPDGSKLGWFLVTSANLSKAAWGKLNKNQDRLTVMSWEAGVLFIPQLFGSANAFPVSKSTYQENGTFLLPFDLPLIKYAENDEPWQMETLRDAQ